MKKIIEVRIFLEIRLSFKYLLVAYTLSNIFVSETTDTQGKKKIEIGNKRLSHIIHI